MRGFGFGEDATVTIGNNECKVVHATDTELNCRTPAVSALTLDDLLHYYDCIIFIYSLFHKSMLMNSGASRITNRHSDSIKDEPGCR